MNDRSSKPSVDARIQTISLLVLAMIGVMGSFYFLRSVLVPFVLAVFIWLCLVSIIDLLSHRLSLPYWAAITAALLLTVLAFLVIVLVVGASITDLSSNPETYTNALDSLLAKISSFLPGEQDVLSEVPMGSLGGVVQELVLAVGDVVSQSVVVIIFTMFLLFGSPRHQATEGTWAEIEGQIRKYIVTKTAVSALTGVLVGTALAIIGVPMAVVFGLLAFALNFIPNLGSLIATILPLPLAMTVPDNPVVTTILALVIPLAIQQVVGSVLEPKLLGKSLDLHPITILIALMFWGVIWGIVGMLLATPLTAGFRILMTKLEITQPVAEVMAGRFGAKSG